MIKKLALNELAEAIEGLPLHIQAGLAATIQQRLAAHDHEQGRNADVGSERSTLNHEPNETFKAFLARMPDVGEDHEFIFAHDLPRNTDL